MTEQQALAVLLILAFACFVIWGRTAPGQAVLIRLFGPPPASKKRVVRTRKRATGAARAPRPAGQGARKPAAKRAANKRTASR